MHNNISVVDKIHISYINISVSVKTEYLRELLSKWNMNKFETICIMKFSLHIMTVYWNRNWTVSLIDIKYKKSNIKLRAD